MFTGRSKYGSVLEDTDEGVSDACGAGRKVGTAGTGDEQLLSVTKKTQKWDMASGTSKHCCVTGFWCDLDTTLMSLPASLATHEGQASP